MHASASKASIEKGIGFISQLEMSSTVFGFMGFALIQPEMLGIFNNSEEDREGFVYFWAVIGYMLGIEDEHNFCLNSLDVVEAICKIYLRHFFMLWLQLETPLFRKMANAFIDGMADFLPLGSYQSTIFLAKRIAGIPGYQYSVDQSKEIEFKDYFEDNDLIRMKENFRHRTGYEYMQGICFTNNFHLIEVLDDYQDCDDNIENSKEFKGLADIFGLNTSDLSITEITTNEFPGYLNDDQFYCLTWWDRLLVKINIIIIRYQKFAWFKYLAESGLSSLIKKMENL
jgi:hypothetical protein